MAKRSAEEAIALQQAGVRYGKKASRRIKRLNKYERLEKVKEKVLGRQE